MAESTWSSGAVLLPASSSLDWWDKRTFSGPVVVREPNSAGFRMYYYGRGSDEWNFGVKPFSPSVPTGRIGMAISSDGVSFQRACGRRPGGAVFDPADDPAAFDAVHVAVGDVVADGGDWRMYYFGGGMEAAPLVGAPASAPLYRGVKLQTGLAVSKDGGATFDRMAAPLVAVGGAEEWDRNGVSWPRVLPPDAYGNARWLTTYHTRTTDGAGGAAYFAAGLATSSDGISWEKRGKILGPGAPGSWDEGGVSVRHVINLGPDRGFIMLYEGSNYAFEFAIGLATSSDGLNWEKDDGGPVFTARKGEEVWDNFIVGTPYVIRMEDGSLRMYYLGLGIGSRSDGSTAPGIGLAVCDGVHLRRWTRV